jgi:hypothetical protein
MATKNRVEVKPTTCSRCGHNDVAWVQGTKSGKWYLVEGGLVDPDLKSEGKLVYSRFQFHKCNLEHR